ncbi:hypothetical protein OSH08_10630 [Kaistia geumhonensis]|uniref:Secreted protein n=1 Tax=Kaistia geumhonensis TaxID=410839 RepID=A0ABU0M313_9HYPH|nr:hypothetical protein [Kaistia geumhonensis]MCX5479462.1 hypothetical protein [Kaistia geumhonensis]MDQ0515315.1 hypothetical protein [Kaistia geumhonensis]
MRLFAAASLIVLMTAGPALADDGARLTGVPAALLSGAAAEGTQHEIPNPPAPTIAAGPATIILGQTPLADLHEAFGGTLHHASDGVASADWLCYQLDADGRAELVWFVSDGESGGDSKLVTLVAAAYAQPNPVCDAPSNGLASPQPAAPMPGLGGSLADLEKAYGPVSPRDGMVAYINQGAAMKGGFTAFQSINYLLSGDSIVAFGASQISVR